MPQLDNKDKWPVLVGDSNTRDGRYSINIEHTGHEYPSFVFRFCDDFISSHKYYAEAVIAINEYINIQTA